ncbi:MAG: hypothetical protein ACR2HV_06825 [Acidimicrobiales bacterium]
MGDRVGDQVGERVKEAAYAAVGLGVLGVQRIQVRRRDVTRQVEPQVREAAEKLQRLASAADEAVNPVLDRLEERLSDAARERVRAARGTAVEARDTVLRKAASGRS